MASKSRHPRHLAVLLGASLLASGALAAPAFAAEAPPLPQGPPTLDVHPYVPTCFGRTVTLFVPPGGAMFYGSSDPAVVDVILGTSGEDQIDALAGNDFICGGDAYDRILGGSGQDWLDGQGGGDSIYGGPGNDVLYGSADGDLLLGEGDSDILFGERGDDELACDSYPGAPDEGSADAADGGLGLNDNLIGGAGSGCESVVNVEFG